MGVVIVLLKHLHSSLFWLH